QAFLFGASTSQCERNRDTKPAGPAETLKLGELRAAVGLFSEGAAFHELHGQKGLPTGSVGDRHRLTSGGERAATTKPRAAKKRSSTSSALIGSLSARRISASSSASSFSLAGPSVSSTASRATRLAWPRRL